MPRIKQKYSSLEDFLASVELTVDGELDDGGGAHFAVKGRELEATILFCDISGFSKRTKALSSTETLAFVNNFFTWISTESLRNVPCIVDKYIGDEIMVIFAQEFGSSDPFAEAIQVARWMVQNDHHAFCPHIGIASGLVTIGYVGTPLRYNCSAFGAPVTLAARCASVKPANDATANSWITFPASEWEGRELNTLFPPRVDPRPDGSRHIRDQTWTIGEAQSVKMKNLGNVDVRIALNHMRNIPSQSAVDRARDGVSDLKKANRYWPSGRS